MRKTPKAFISYSHVDRAIAERIAEGLRAGGIEAWLDKYEIIPGDSLIKKIFEEGLAGADVFVVILTESSIKSNWVRQELDVALIKRIEGITRVIPLKIGNINIPDPLQTVQWIDMAGDFDEKLRQLQMAIFQIRAKPPIGHPPEFIRNQLASVGGLSRLATALGLYFLQTGTPNTGNEESFRESELAEELGFTPEEADDAVDELLSLGLVKTQDYLGTGPYSHGDVEATYALFLHFKDEGLGYDPEDDIKMTASAIAAQKQVDGKKIMELTGLTPLRINRAIGYIEDFGIARVEHAIGTGPFDFDFTFATGSTRRFVEEKAK
jgi:hypothetical protein